MIKDDTPRVIYEWNAQTKTLTGPSPQQMALHCFVRMTQYSVYTPEQIDEIISLIVDTRNEMLPDAPALKLESMSVDT